MKTYSAPVFLLAGAVFATMPNGALAQEVTDAPPRPIVTVAAFNVDGSASRSKNDVGDGLADLLADQLVASGQYRAMERVWLEHDSSGFTPIEAHRAAAARAGVAYLIVGRVTTRTSPPSTGRGPIAAPAFGPLIVARLGRPPMGMSPMVRMPIPGRRPPETTFTVAIEMIDVAAGTTTFRLQTTGTLPSLSTAVTELGKQLAYAHPESRGPINR